MFTPCCTDQPLRKAANSSPEKGSILVRGNAWKIKSYGEVFKLNFYWVFLLKGKTMSSVLSHHPVPDWMHPWVRNAIGLVQMLYPVGKSPKRNVALVPASSGGLKSKAVLEWIWTWPSLLYLLLILDWPLQWTSGMDGKYRVPFPQPLNLKDGGLLTTCTFPLSTSPRRCFVQTLSWYDNFSLTEHQVQYPHFVQQSSSWSGPSTSQCIFPVPSLWTHNLWPPEPFYCFSDTPSLFQIQRLCRFCSLECSSSTCSSGWLLLDIHISAEMSSS